MACSSLRRFGPLQQALVLLDRAADLSLLAIQVAEDQVDLERIAGDLRRLLQLVDRRIDLVGDEEVQPEHVVRRLARAAPIGPHAVLQLVALPRLADGEAQRAARRRHASRTIGVIAAPARPDSRSTAARQAPCACRMCSISSRTAPRPPARSLTQCTRRADFRRRVRGRGREADAAQHRQVLQVVAHVGRPASSASAASRRIRSYAASLSAAPCTTSGMPSWAARCDVASDARAGQQADLQPGALRPDDRRAVADVERLGFAAVGDAARIVPSVSTPSTSSSSSRICRASPLMPSDHLRAPQIVQVDDSLDGRFSSTTMTDVILWVSMTRSASTARTSRGTVIGLAS